MKTCFGCEAFNFETAEPDLSEMTPGNEAALTCAKEVWKISLYQETERSLHEKLTAAETCQHYTFAKERFK